MHSEDKNLRELAVEVSKGDPTAAGELRHRLKPQMTLMARQVMRRGHGSTPMARRILTEAHRMWGDNKPPQPEFLENMLGTIVDNLCDSVITGLRASSPAPQSAKDTVWM